MLRSVIITFTGWLIVLLCTCSTPISNGDRVLIFFKTAGYHHASIKKGAEILMNACLEKGIPVDTSADASLMTPDKLKDYKAVIFLNTSGDILNDEQQKAFETYIMNGGGFVGIHAATDTEDKWPWYNELVGAYFLSHPQQQKAVIQVTDKKHPATSFLPDRWERFDEWYNFKSISPDIHVLANLDETSYTGGANGPQHPFIWYHEIGKGRAFYTGVGHRDDNYEEPLVIRHIVEAIRWAGKIE